MASPLLVTTTLTPDNTSDASFRAWGSAVSAKFGTAGMVQTGDTGQINWSTVTTPGAAATPQGYEIWRFNDTLQATAPVFFKIEYGSASGSALRPGMWITFGSGSNGSGTLTGNTSVRQAFGSATNSASAGTCYFCGDNNRFVAALWVAGTGSSALLATMLSFERTVDSSGAVTSEGVMILVKTGSSSYSQVHWNCTTGPTSTWETTIGAMGPAQGTGISGSQIAVYPIFFTKGVFLNPGLNLLAYVGSDFSTGSSLSVSHYATSHTYMPLGTTTIAGSLSRTIASSSLMMRYD